MTDTKRQLWFERGEPHERPQTPRMFKIVNMIRKFSGPQARRELGLSDFEWRVMAQVGHAAPMSLNEMAAVSRHDKGQLSRGVKRLVEAGLLVRESRRGERGVFISPTPAGRKLYDRMIDLAFRQNDLFFDGVSQAEIEAFSKVLDKIEANTARLLMDEPECPPGEPDGEAEPQPARARKLAKTA